MPFLMYKLNSDILYLNAYTEWMVALATLSTGQKTALCTKTKTPTHHAHVLKRKKDTDFPNFPKQGLEKPLTHYRLKQNK